MSMQDKKMLDREAVRTVIQQWNANRLDLFALSEPDENLLFHGVMRFYFQDAGQKVATKCIRVASDATVSDVIETLIEKFRPDMRMLSVPNYALYEVHANGEERRLNPDEKPLLVQLNWHIDDREGRFLLRNIDQKTTTIESTDNNFKRKLSKREKKEQKKKEKLAKLNSDSGSISGGGGNGGSGNGIGNDGNDENHVAEKLYIELPETSFTRSISNPEAVMRRRRQQKLEQKLQQFRSRDGGPDTGGTLKIYGESLCRDVPYKTLLLSIRDCAQAVVREMLAKYGLDKIDPLHYCLVQVNSDGSEYILDDDECPLSILMNYPTSRGSIMFHVRRRPADSQPRRRKKKPLGVPNGTNNICEREGPMLVEVTHSGDGGRRIKLGSDPIEVGSANTNSLQLFGPSIQARHCLISLLEGVCTVTPLHTDALTFVNGHHITQPTILHNGSVVMFGRVSSYRFHDSPSDGRYNLALSQSQLDSACLYESRSPASPQSWNDDDRSPNVKTDFDKIHQTNSINTGIGSGGGNNNNNNNNTNTNINNGPLNSAENSMGNATAGGMTTTVTGGGSAGGSINTIMGSNNDNDKLRGQIKETDFAYDPEGNIETETKSISSIKSGGSNNQETRTSKISMAEMQQGQEPILPAVLEFPETHQENFLRQVITDLDVNAPNFKLSPVYTLYLCARYRASTHYRPELQPTERAHKLTIFLHHVANLIYSIIQDQYNDPRVLAFWMANSSEFLHFLKSDRHISAFSVQAQEVLAESVQSAFRNLVNCFRVELSQTLNQFLSENIDHESAAGFVLTVLGSAMALLRRCRVNAALTIQLFSQLFHYINVICFNTIVANSHMCTAEWGKVMLERLQLLEFWAERQGLELAADCHLAKINQCAQFLQAPKTTVEEIQKLTCSCFRLNSLQMGALLQQEQIPRNLIDTAIRMAESVADELTRADGREVRLEESPELHLALLLPDDGFSCDVVRGIPSGLVDFLNPLQAAGMCRLAAQPTSIGLWTVYMHQFNTRSPSSMSNKLSQPEVQVIKLHKNSNGMGLSIVAAKGAGQERLGIYIKSVVPGGAADADGRLQAGDQLLRVDGQSLIGITQERAADYLVRTGPIVSLEVAKQGAIYHGLATLLQQPSPVIQRDADDIIPIIPPHPININYGSGSDESVHSVAGVIPPKYEIFPILYSNYPHRRRSSSSLQEELCARGETLHIDPRYRDTRPIARSSSSLILAPEHNSSPIRAIWDMGPAPSIFIEQYNDDLVTTPKSDNLSNESLTQLNLTQIEAHEPLNEDSLASCSGDQLDQIPFIDDGTPPEEDKPYIPPDGGEFFRRSRSSISSNTSCGAGGGIIKEPRSNSGCRKTVSFDLIDDRPSSTSFDGSDAKFSRKSRTFDTISSTKPMNSNKINISNLILKTETNDLEHNDNSEESKKKESLLRSCKNNTFSIEQYDDLDLDLSELKSTSSSSRSSCIGNRRMSERDINRIGDSKNQLGQQSSNQLLPNSKSVPALHHVGGGAMANSKSRSIHSLVNNNNEQGFYQNLSVYRAQNQSQPILNERQQITQQGSIASGMNQPQIPSNTLHQQQQQQNTTNMTSTNSNVMTNQQQSILNRPSSAYYHTSNQNNTNNSMPSPNSMMSYNMSASSTNLTNGMSPNLSTMQQSGQHAVNRLKMNQQNFNSRDLQSQQQNLRINSMMAPSMPNIAAAHSTISYPGQISSSQSMQNVNMIPSNNSQPQSVINNEMSQHQFQNGPLHLITASQNNQQQFDGSPVQYHHHTMNPTAAQIRGQGKMIEMAEHATRRLHGGENLNIHVGLTGKLPMHSPQNQSQMPPQMSPIKQLPPTAPKPQHMLRNQATYSLSQPETIHEERHNTPPLPPTTTHPLFKNTSTQNINYVASTLDPPKAAYYPVASSHHQHLQKNYLPANPWEREEREKEHEIRREHIRQWRDHQISELSVIPIRSPQQEDQLKTLVLERDFERRAQETEEQEDDNEISYNKDNVQEVIRLAQQSSITTPITNFRQADKISTQSISSGNTNINNNANTITTNEITSNILTNSSMTTSTTTTTTTTAMTDPQQSFQSFSIQQSQIIQTPTTVQPKSILKNNRHGVDPSSNTPGSPSKSHKTASFADDHKLITQTEMSAMSQLAKDINSLDLNNGNQDHMPLDITRDTINTLDNGGPPPPPPERNSSYLVMSQQQQKIRNPALIKGSTGSDINANSPSVLISGNNTSAVKQRPSLLNNNNNNINNNNSNNNNNNNSNNNNNNNNTNNNNINNNSININNHNNNNINNNNNNIIMSPHTPLMAITTTTTHSLNSPHIPISSTTTQNILNMNRDNKRVSFHDEENNFVLSQDYSPEQADLDIIREDPNRFIQETNALLQTPTTPESDMWNTTVQSTPGVIGAQEVYRDPRTRRLAEQQQKQQQKSSEAVPEKLSFKEKMKMFALESGENQTPKDKLKISRAQRDIDAVH